MAQVVTAQRALAQSIVRRLRNAGHEAYFAGGCVRDRLIGIEPKDYDVATSATPDQMEAVFSHTTPIGRAFGVLLIHDEHESTVTVEVATFRADGTYSDGRRPESVTFSSAKEDALRRDFTINGMFMDPVTGDVIDYVGGKADIEARLVRAIGDPVLRFTEDRLRLMRGVRFACRYNFAIEPATHAAIVALAPGLREVSAERIRQELDGMIHGPARGRAIRDLAETGLLGVAMPQLAFAPEGVSAIARTASLLDMADRDRLNGGLAWALLLHSCEGAPHEDGSLPPETPDHALTIMRRLTHSVNDMQTVRDILAAVGVAAKLREAPLEQVKRFLRGRGVSAALEFDRMLAVWDEVRGIPGARERIATAAAATRALAHYSGITGLGGLHPPALLNGNDVMAMGVKAGAKVGELLRRLEDATLGERISDRAAAESLVRQWIAEGSA